MEQSEERLPLGTGARGDQHPPQGSHGEEVGKEREEKEKERGAEADAEERTGENDNLILRKHYAYFVGMLAQADELTAKVASLRITWDELLRERLPQLERLTSIESVEATLLRPHRERLARLRAQQREEQARQQRLLVERTLSLLRSDVSLAVCLRLVSTLRQQPDVPREQLPALFLAARTAFITSIIERNIIGGGGGVHNSSTLTPTQSGMPISSNVSLPAPITEQLEAIVRVMRGPVLDVVAQYGALFGGEPLPLAAFLGGQISWCVTSVTALVRAARNTALLAAYWNQLVILNATLAGVRAAFLSLVEGVFREQARALLTQALASATSMMQSRWEEAASRERLGAATGRTSDNRASVPGDSGGGTVKEMRAPVEILRHPLLILINNSLVDVFDQIRAFALPSLYPMVRELLQAHLQVLETTLLAELPEPSPEAPPSMPTSAPFSGSTSPSSSSPLPHSPPPPGSSTHVSSQGGRGRERVACFREHLRPFLLESTLATLFPNAVDCGVSHLSQ